MARYFFIDPDTYEDKGIRKHFKTVEAAERLEGLAERFENIEPFTLETVEEAVRLYAGELNISAGKLIHPTRLAVSGVTYGPGLFDIIVLVGRERTVARMRQGASFIREREKE
jgi:glutamyl-tRNA synthetase